MYLGFGPLCSKTSRKTKSAFFIQALHGMNSRLPADTVREDLAANACCKSGVRLKNSREFAHAHADLGIPDRLRMKAAALWCMPSRIIRAAGLNVPAPRHGRQDALRVPVFVH